MLKLTPNLPSKLPKMCAPRRRSKSLSEMNGEHLKPTSSTWDIQNLEHPMHLVGGSLRGSGSCRDLGATQKAPLKTGGAVVRGLKRQNPVDLETIIKKSKTDPVKLTKDKTPKPAPCDYEARYNLLLEKCKTLEETVKETRREQTRSLKEATERNQVQAGQLKKLKAKIYNLELVLAIKNKKLENASKDNEHVNKENEHFTISLETLQAEKKHLQDVCSAQIAEIAQLKTTFYEQSIKLDTYELQIFEYSEAEISFKNALEKAEISRRHMHNLVQELKGNIRVLCRVRPADSERLECNINYLNENTLEIQKSKDSLCPPSGKMGELKMEFSFDRIYPPQAQQRDIFDELSQLVQSAIDGYHVCIFAYGQTGSGKTYTMQGLNTSDQEGVIPRSITLLYDIINQAEKVESEFQTHASFLEIYNETLHDLLKPNSKKKLCIQYNEGKGVTVTNLTIAPVQTAEDLTSLMKTANINRAVATTDFNEHSSRSHAVTKIYIKSLNKSTQAVFEGSLNFVDLAGSESANTSSCERLCETKNINKSLSTLGTVMLALHNNNAHIPYRNSKLTYLLQSCLGGNCKTLMILNVSPFEDCYGETLTSLRFASKIKNVKTECRRNKTYASPGNVSPRD